MNRHLQLALSVVLAIGGFAFLLCLLAFSAGQAGTAMPSEVNPFGAVGTWIAHLVLRIFGLAGFLLPTVAIGWAVALWRDRDLSNPSRRLAGALLLLPTLSGLVHLLPSGSGDWLLMRWDQSNLEGLGGAIGFMLCAPAHGWANQAFGGGYLRAWLDTAGSAVVLAALAMAALWLMDLGLLAWARRLWSVFYVRREPGMSSGSSAIPSGVYPEHGDPVANKARATTSFRELSKRLTDGGSLPGPSDADEILAAIRRQREGLASPTVEVPAAY